MRKKVILLLFCVMCASTAGAQFVPGEQDVLICSDGPAFYAEVNTHAYSVYKVFGYSASGKLAKQKPEVINIWVGMDPNPRIFPLKSMGEDYLFTTTDRGLFVRNADMAFFLNDEWDNNGGYKVNYHPKDCKRASIKDSYTGDGISDKSWAIVLEKLAQIGGNKGVKKDASSGCVDATGGHALNDCANRMTEPACSANPNCRWIRPPQSWPPSTDH